MVFKILGFLAIFGLVNCLIVNDNVDRVLDLSSHLVKETLQIVAREINNKPFTHYELSLSEIKRRHLSFLSVEDTDKNRVNINETFIENRNSFILSFPSALTQHVINIHMVFANLIELYPEKIKQNEKQLVKYKGQLHFFSPYLTRVQKTTIQLDGNVISFTQAKPFSEVSKKIKFGPYEDVGAFSNQTIDIHYENNTPFMTVTYLERILEISHWGNVAVKENIYLSHTGARLEGSFSRYEFQKDARSGLSAIKSYKTILPAAASEVYYRDTNGNISTLTLKTLKDYVELELRPRFPLFGGWKTYYSLGYNLPSYEYLYNKQQTYVLQIRVIDHIYDEMLINEAVVKVIFPEGSSNFEMHSPYPVERHADELMFSYLDTIGRPVIVFSKKNMVENHIANFQIKYTFSKMLLMHEPLLAIAFIFAVFLICIISLRLDCDINTHYHKE